MTAIEVLIVLALIAIGCATVGWEITLPGVAFIGYMAWRWWAKRQRA